MKQKGIWGVHKMMSPGLPWGSAGKESACKAGDLCLIPGLGRSPGEGKGCPLQYSGLENSMDCIVHGVAELDTTERLSLSGLFLSVILFSIGFFLRRILSKCWQALGFQPNSLVTQLEDSVFLFKIFFEKIVQCYWHIIDIQLVPLFHPPTPHPSHLIVPEFAFPGLTWVMCLSLKLSLWPGCCWSMLHTNPWSWCGEWVPLASADWEMEGAELHRQTGEM